MCEGLAVNKRRTVIEDPTRQAGNRRRALAAMRRRLAGAQDQIIDIIDGIPATIVASSALKVNRTTYEWQLSPERLNRVEALIRETIDAWFQTEGDQIPPRWFFQTYMEASTQPGAADAVNNLRLLSQGVADPTDLDRATVQAVFTSPQYQTVIQNIYGRAYNDMKGFSGETGADLARTLADAVLAGRSPRDTKKLIRDRFGVADSRAERIVRTEINRAYTISRTTAAQETAARLEVEMRVLHRSSLMPTTRRHHAERHGRVYEIQDQNDWWDEGANRINCLCSISEVVIDSEGNIRSRGLQERMEKQREAWLSTPVERNV